MWAPPGSSNHSEEGEQDGGATGKWGKREFATHWIVHFDLGRICPNFRGKPSPLKACCWVCV
jgi:hypothetical protein